MVQVLQVLYHLVILRTHALLATWRRDWAASSEQHLLRIAGTHLPVAEPCILRGFDASRFCCGHSCEDACALCAAWLDCSSECRHDARLCVMRRSFGLKLPVSGLHLRAVTGQKAMTRKVVWGIRRLGLCVSSSTRGDSECFTEEKRTLIGIADIAPHSDLGQALTERKMT